MKLKQGDRVWIKTPRELTERKIGTIMTIKKTLKGPRYLIEWEVDLTETPNHHPGYFAEEIVPIALRISD